MFLKRKVIVKISNLVLLITKFIKVFVRKHFPFPTMGVAPLFPIRNYHFHFMHSQQLQYTDIKEAINYAGKILLLRTECSGGSKLGTIV